MQTLMEKITSENIQIDPLFTHLSLDMLIVLIVYLLGWVIHFINEGRWTIEDWRLKYEWWRPEFVFGGAGLISGTLYF